MRRRPPRSTRPDTLFPYTTLFRSFIWANMPLGKPYSLTEQEAWDVAAFINSHERPKDTRQTGTVAEALEKYHEGEQSYYGKVLGGKLLGVGKIGRESCRERVCQYV